MAGRPGVLALSTAVLLGLALLPAVVHAADSARASSPSAADTSIAALASYEAAVAKNPRDAEAWLGLAQVRAAREEWQEAIEAYQRAVELGPVGKDVRMAYADALRQAGRLDLAVQQYELVLKAPSPDELLAAAQQAISGGDVRQAELLLRQVLDERPNDGAAWLGLARVQAAQLRWSDAAGAFRNADAAGRLDTPARTEYADALRNAGELEAAVEQYEIVVHAGSSVQQPGIPETESQLVPATDSPTKISDEAVLDPHSQAGFRESAAMRATPVEQPASTPKASKPSVEKVWPVELARVAQEDSTSIAEEVPPTAPPLKSDVTDARRPGAGQFFVPRDAASVNSYSSQDGGAGTGTDTGSGTGAGNADSVFEAGTSAVTRDRQTPKQGETEVQPQTQDEWLAYARELSKAEKWTDAVNAFQQALALSKLEMPVHLEYAEALRQAGELGLAEEEYNRVLHNDASNIDAKIGLAKVLALGGKLDEAMYLLDQLETNAEAVRRARIARVYAYFVNDYVQEAWRDIGDLLAREPQNAEALALVKQKASWDQIKAALEGVPGNVELISLMEDIIKAEAAMSEIEPTAQSDRAEWYYQRGDVAKAQRDFEALVEADPQDVRAWQRLAQIYTWDKAWDDALDAYDQYLRLVPEDYWAILRHAQVLLYMGNPEEAADELWSLIMDSAAPIEVYQEALLAYAVALNASGRSQEAMHWFEEALVFQPRNVEVLSSYASALAGQKRYDDAIHIYESVLREASDNDAARLGMAQVYSWKGDQAMAIRMFETVSMDSDYYSPSRIGMAYAYLWDGKRSDALAMAEIAQRIDPNNPELIALLQRLNEKPDPVLSTDWRQSRDNETNHSRIVGTQLTIPLDARGSQLAVQYDDIKLESTSPALESKGSTTGLVLDLPVGDNSRLQGRADSVNLKNGTDPKLNEWEWGAAFRTNVNRDWSWGAGYSSDVLYETAQLARNDVRLKELMLTTDFRLGNDHTRFITEYGSGDLSDGNSRQRWNFNIRRTALWRDRGRLNYGIAARRLDYSKDLANGYWDPNNYRFGELYLDWLDLSDHAILVDAGAGLGMDESAATKSRTVLRYNLGLRAPLADNRLWLRAGYASSEGGDVAATQPGYTQHSWYFDADYTF